MRYLVRVLLPAAVILLAGCSLFGSHDVRVARITSILAPDTAFVDSTFQVTLTALLGPDSGYVLDHFEVTNSTDAKLTVRVWSRDTASVRPVTSVAMYFDVQAAITPTEPGKYLAIGYQPDGKDTVKTITVLP
jgi:hypothetical protein